MQGDVVGVVVMRGKEIRLERIINRNTKRTIIVPMDHGVSQGPIEGLIDLGQTVNLVAHGGANAVLGHIGLALYGHRQGGPDIGLILHLSASTIAPDPNEKVLVNTVTNALSMGADAVSMHVNIGADSEARMLAGPGAVAVQCMEWGMPLLAMMYPRGKNIEDEQRCRPCQARGPRRGRARRGHRQDRVHGRPGLLPRGDPGLPRAGRGRGRLKDRRPRHPRTDRRARWPAGAAGISIGRNAFQHRHPAQFVRAAACIVHESRSVDEALKIGGATMIGKEIRLERCMDRNTGRAVIVPMDHGFSMGQIEGLLDMTNVISEVRDGGERDRAPQGHGHGRAPAARPGHRPDRPPLGLDRAQPRPERQGPGLHGRGGHRARRGCGLDPHQPRLAERVAHARGGANVSRDCTRWGMPLLIMAYARGQGIDGSSPIGLARGPRGRGARRGPDQGRLPGRPEAFRKIVSFNL